MMNFWIAFDPTFFFLMSQLDIILADFAAVVGVITSGAKPCRSCELATSATLNFDEIFVLLGLIVGILYFRIIFEDYVGTLWIVIHDSL